MKIEENVYALESTKGSYSYLIKDKETILIDTGNLFQYKWHYRQTSRLLIAIVTKEITEYFKGGKLKYLKLKMAEPLLN